MITFYTNPQSRDRIARWPFFAADPLEQAVVAISFGWLTKDRQAKGRTGCGDLADVVAALSACRARMQDRPALKVTNDNDNALIPETRA